MMIWCLDIPIGICDVVDINYIFITMGFYSIYKWNFVEFLVEFPMLGKILIFVIL